MNRRNQLIGCVFGGMVWWAATAHVGQGAFLIPFTTIDQGAHSGLQQPSHAVLRTWEQWATLWAQHVGPSAVPPSVDFSTEMVIAVFIGRRSTAGYEVEITQVLLTDQGLRVTYRERTPPAGALVRPVLTAPFHIIRLPRSDLPVDMLQEP